MPTPIMNHNYSTLDEIFGVQYEEHEINENLLFNSEMLNRCRQDCKHNIDRAVAQYGLSLIHI